MKDLKIKITDILTGETNIKIFSGECFLSTGFFDRNNKEIFEGDEIECEFRRYPHKEIISGIVLWDQAHAGFAIKQGILCVRLCDVSDPIVIKSVGDKLSVTETTIKE